MELESFVVDLDLGCDCECDNVSLEERDDGLDWFVLVLVALLLSKAAMVAV